MTPSNDGQVLSGESVKAKHLAAHFRYLDRLRESGATNMYSATAYLERDRGLKRADALKILSSWMKTFSPDEPITRAIAALKAGA